MHIKILDLYIVQIFQFKAVDLSLVRTCRLELFPLNPIMILQYPNSCKRFYNILVLLILYKLRINLGLSKIFYYR
jgi:hypothetical protein